MTSTLFVVLSIFLVSSFVHATEPVSVRISVENSESHVQTRAVATFADELQRILGDRYRVEFYHSAHLFRDRDVFSALASGQVDMAVPGTWQLDSFVPNIAAFLLPYFFGRSAEFVHSYSDGPLGLQVAAEIEEVLGVKVIGRWLDLGSGHLFTTSAPIRAHSDLEGRRVRVAGGRANELRIAAMGGEPVSIAWTDLPAHLATGSIDAVLTTHETIRSAELWTEGIRGAYEDHQYFPQYVPMMREGLWYSLSPDQRDRTLTAWEALVSDQRREAATAQLRARSELIRNGVTVVTPTAGELNAVRESLLGQQGEMARQLGVDADLLPLGELSSVQGKGDAKDW